MRSLRNLMLALVASGLAATSVAAPVAASPEPGNATATSMAQASGESRAQPSRTVATVTLITGDRVRLTKSEQGLTAVPSAAPGRSGVAFGVRRQGDALYVIPSDVSGLLASNRLDPRLFDVAALVEAGYADDRRSTLPLILQHKARQPVAADSASGKPAGATIGRELRSVSATAVREKKAAAPEFWEWLTGRTATKPGARVKAGGALAENVRKVWLDGAVRASLDVSVPQTGAPSAWESGYTGEGVKVAVLDTGIDAGHPDLDDAVIAERNFTDSDTTADRVGHGTHVASIITGNGDASNGKYQGVAPDVELLNGKVLDDTGWGTESEIIAGMEWAVAQDAKVINMSLGGGPTDGTDPMSVALNELSASSGALFVVAAGNLGPGRYTVSTPAAADAALTVAGTNRDYSTADFSGAGPRVGDYAMKPDLAAPGADIVAAKAEGTELGEPVGEDYVTLSGTSMAAPHVAGAAAILAQQKPSWAGNTLKANLMGTTRLPVDASVYYQGAGFVNIPRALSQKVFALEGGVSAYLKWPHTEPDSATPGTTAGVQTKTLTYRNPRSTPLTLNLASDLVDQNGDPAAAGVISMPETVTIPAYTTKAIQITIDPTKSAPGLQYRGRITATAGSVTVRTPVSIHVELETYDVTLDITDRNGDKVTNLGDGRLVGVPVLLDVTNAHVVQARAVDGKLVIRAPRGAYTLTEAVYTPDPDGGSSVTLLAKERITVVEDTTVTLDAREGTPAAARLSGGEAQTTSLAVGAVQVLANGMPVGLIVGGSGEAAQAYVVGTPEFSRPFEFMLYHELATPGRSYELVFGEQGAIPADATYPVAAGDLAEVSTVVGAHGIRANSALYHDAVFGELGAAWGSVAEVGTPLAEPLTKLVSVEAMGGPVRWYTTMLADLPDGTWAYDEFLTEEPYQAGGTYTVKLSTAAFTPQVAGWVYEDGWMDVFPEPFNSSGGGTIYPYADQLSGSAKLTKDGTLVATSNDPFIISTDRAGGSGRYHLTMAATRVVPWSNYAAKVDGSWLFDARAPESGDAELTLLSPLVGGDFDGFGRAQTGEPFQLVVTERGGNDLASVAVKLSYDDGRTWVEQQESQVDGSWVVDVEHPGAAGNVSLRVNVKDGSGNAATVTTIRAYRIADLG